MYNEKSIVPINKEAAINKSDVVNQTILAILEGITGIASSEKSDWIRSFGHLFQRIRGGEFLNTFREEWNEYRDKGRVKDDYIFTDQHQECLQELLDFLEQDNPDKIRFTILKKIFLIAATESISDRDNILPQQYMKICRSLTTGGTILLLSMYKLAKKEIQTKEKVLLYRDDLVTETGFLDRELVMIHEKNLLDNNLISWHSEDKLNGTASFYISGLGLKICQFIEQYDLEN